MTELFNSYNSISLHGLVVYVCVVATACSIGFGIGFAGYKLDMWLQKKWIKNA